MFTPFQIKALLGNDAPVTDEEMDEVRNKGVTGDLGEDPSINQLPQPSPETLALVDEAIGRPGESSSQEELQQQSDAARAAKAQPTAQVQQASNPAPAPKPPTGPDGIPDKEREDLDYYLAAKGMEGEDMLNESEPAARARLTGRPVPPPAQESKAAQEEPAQVPTGQKKWVDGQGWVPEMAPAPQVTADGRLASTAPNWYQYLAPPNDTNDQIAGTLFSGLLKGILGAAAADAGAKRHHRKGAGAEGFMKGFIGEGIAPAMGQIINAPRQRYQDELAAARAQADMHAKLSAHNDSLAAERLKLAQEKWLKQQQEAAEKAALAAEMDDPNSAESRKHQQALIDQLPNPSEEDIAAIRTRPGSILTKYRAQYGNQASQLRGLVNAMKMHDERTKTQLEMKGVDDTMWHEHRAHELGDVKDKEERKRQADIEEAEIPGTEFVGKRAPNQADVSKAREMMDATNRAYHAARRLAELQNNLNAYRVSGKLYKYFAKDPGGKLALAQAHINQKALMDAQRKISELGVLQGFEKDMIETYNPEVGTLDEFMNGRWNYHAYVTELPGMTDVRLRPYKYKIAKDSEMYEPLAPPEEVDVIQELKNAGSTGREAASNAAAAVGQVLKNAEGTAEAVAPDAVNTAKAALAKAQAEYDRLTGGGGKKQAPAQAPAQPQAQEPKDHHVRVTIQNGQGVPPTVEEHMVTKTEYVRALRKARQQQGTRVELLSQ